MPSTVNQLSDEVLAQVSVAAPQQFQDRIVTVHNAAELENRLRNDGFPLCVIAYEGTFPAEGNQGLGSTGRASSVNCDTLLVNKQFSVIVAVEYNWNTELDDQKRAGLDLLDLVRGRLQGFIGVNNRPWRFVNEGPIADSIDGVILYAQVWETAVMETGNTT